MRNKHGKGRIHPSPSQHPPPAPGPGDCLSVLSLLPAAILALVAALCLEDKEVLAYFITRCVIGSDEAAGIAGAGAGAEQPRKKGGKGGAPAPHPPRFDCGCFGCYTSFWIRWGSSPHGELIHQAIEAFERHLAEGEGAAARRGREKKERRDATSKAGRKGKKKKAQPKDESHSGSSGVVGAAEQDAAAIAALVGAAAAGIAEGGSSSSSSAVKAAAAANPAVQCQLALVPAGAAEPEASDRPVLEVAEWSDDSDGGRCGGGGDKKKPWLDVMGFLNSRLWSLWSPAA